MTDLQTRLKALLYLAGGAAMTDLPSVPSPAPALPRLTDDMCEAFDDTAGLIGDLA